MGNLNNDDDGIDSRADDATPAGARRRFLKGVGALGAAGMAGCLGDDGEGDTPTATEGETPTAADETDTETTTEPPETTTTTPTESPPDANNAILVVSVTKGFRHASIENGNDVLESIVDEIAADMGVDEFTLDVVDANTDDETAYPEDIQSQFPSTVEEFHEYDAVVFQNTTGEIFEPEQQQPAFKEYIETGGGWMGIHAGCDTHEQWPWFEDMAGAWFAGHPAVQEAEIHVTDRTHPATEHLPARWTRTDEWYDFSRNPRGHAHVLATLDERTYDGANMDGGFGRDHPTAWCQNVGQGRSFYTGGGHTAEAFDEPDFQQHLKGGLMWAAGYVDGDANGTVWENYEEETIVEGANGPMKMDISEDGRLFYVERGGEVYAVDLDTGERTNVLSLDVYTGQEDGLVGIALDPDFTENGYLYVCYSPSDPPDDIDTGVNHLGSDMGVNRISRFTMPTNRVDINPDSEQQMLDVVVQRSTCCHAGGDLEFDTQGNLYLVTGDDTNPFESSSRTPIDERDGREPFDAQRSSANTADLRGSAIRISPNEDGSYDIPDGNLIDTIDGASEEEVYPELYAIGFRNPFTAAVDPESDVLYLADYGPDAGGWGNRGPMGTTEYARVDEPGFYGWPYFTGHAVPYRHYDFDTGETGRIFDPDNPTNDSVNNSGLEELPATEGSFVMSPYNWGGYMNYPDEFEEYVPYSSVDEVPFPQVTGGAPMLGTVFRDSEEYSYQALPSSYDGKVFMMEYGSNWIKYATVDEEGNALEVDPFLPDRGFSSPFDMAVGPDGALYVMERGGGSITRFGLSSSVLPVGLSVEGLSGEIRVTTDQEIDITATISNGSSTAVDGVELSLDPSSDDIGVGDGSNTSIGSLGGGASETAEWTVTLPGDLGSGDYSIEAVATYTSNGSEFEVTSALTFAIAG